MRCESFMTGFKSEGRPLGLLAAFALVLHLALAGYAHAGAGLAAEADGVVICTLSGAEPLAPGAAPHDDLCAALCKAAGAAAAEPPAMALARYDGARAALAEADAPVFATLAHALARAPPIRAI